MKCFGEMSSNSRMWCLKTPKLETRQKNWNHMLWDVIYFEGVWPILTHPRNIFRSKFCNHFLRSGACWNRGLAPSVAKGEHPTCGAGCAVGMPWRRGWGHMQVGHPFFCGANGGGGGELFLGGWFFWGGWDKCVWDERPSLTKGDLILEKWWKMHFHGY